MSEDARPLEQLESLTIKQVEVLDLLIKHRTTKEIARELSIAPNTVDQRIGAVREKWGTTNRKDTARHYALLLEQCGKTTCGFSRVDPLGEDEEERGRDLPADPFFVLSDAAALRGHRDWDVSGDDGPAGLEALDARFGRAGRIGAVFLLALVMALILVSSLAIAEVLRRLI